jgi:lactoylglutathione lyase
MKYKVLILIISFIGLQLFMISKEPHCPNIDNKSTKEEKMFLGLRTVVYHVEDLGKAKEWYSLAFKTKPYFNESFYIGFNIGGYELGLIPDNKTLQKGKNVVAYWGVKDINTSFNHFVKIGAKVHEEITDVGGDIKVATVIDPFGNIVGIIENPHFKIK